MKLLKLLASALALVALAACSNMINDLSPGGGTADGADVTSTAASLSVALLGAGNTDLSAVKGNLQLPEVGADDTTVTWSSDTPATVSATGVVTRPATTAATVVLTATITKGTTTVTKTFTVVVTPIPTDPTTAIADDTSTLVAAILKGPNADLNSVKGPLTLPTVGPSGTTITWSSDNAAVSASGNVTRPAVGGTAATVTLTATITKASGTTETKTFTVTVQPLSSDPATAAAEDKAALTSALLAGGSPDLSNVKGPLVLPSTGPGGSTITWSSDIPTTLTGAGTVTRPAAGEAAKTVVLTATITNGTTTTTKTFTVTVLPLSATATATETIAEDKATLTDNVLKGVNPDLTQVKASLTLPTTGASGSTISWATSNSSVVTSTGTITRPAAGAAAVTVTMTATITKAGGTTETKTFTVVVQPIPSDPVVALAEDKASLAAPTILGTNTDTTNVTGNLTLPTTGASGTTIAWTSSDAAVITNTGTVTRPATGAADVSVTLTATLSKTGASDATKTFTVTVKAGAATTSVVTLFAIPGLTAPVTGQTPVTTITATAQYTGTIEWTPTVTTTFARDTAYQAYITLVAKTDWTFAGIARETFTVAGATVLHIAGTSAPTLTVEATFPATAAPPLASGMSASLVLGQTNYTNAFSAATASSLYNPNDIVVSGTKLIIADTGNHRIVIHNTLPTALGATASVIVGQPNATTAVAGTTAATLDSPSGIATDGTRLVVADSLNNRVLIWSTIPTTSGVAADLVLGQADFTTKTPRAQSSTNLVEPAGVAISGTRLLVADRYQQRVLIWTTFPTGNNQAADLVLGSPAFTYSNTGVTAQSIGNPSGVWTDGTKVMVVDYTYSRVLVWNEFPTVNGEAANVVIGQSNFASSNTGNTASTLSLNLSYGRPKVSVDSTGKLYLANPSNHQIFVYNTIPTANGTAANIVLGTASFTPGLGTTTQSTLKIPFAACADATGQVWVADYSNHRILRF